KVAPINTNSVAEGNSEKSGNDNPDLQSGMDNHSNTGVPGTAQFADRGRGSRNKASKTKIKPAADSTVRSISEHPKFGGKNGRSKRRGAGKRSSKGKQPPTLRGYEKRSADNGWVYWKLKLTPTSRRDAKGKIQYKKERVYGIKIGVRAWNILRRYDHESTIKIIHGRIAARNHSTGQRLIIAG